MPWTSKQGVTDNVVEGVEISTMNSHDRTFDCIVLGTGGIGSAALYHLAQRGARVLGLDRFMPGHEQGSSHGHTRIIRLAYFEHPDYVPLLYRAYDLWEALEQDTMTLADLTGQLVIRE